MERQGIIDSIKRALQTENVQNPEAYEHVHEFKTIINKTAYASEAAVRQLLESLKEILIFGRFFTDLEEDIVDFGELDYQKTRNQVIDFTLSLLNNCAYIPVCIKFWEDLILKLINKEIDQEISQFLFKTFDERMGFDSHHILGYMPEKILNHPQEMVLKCLDIYVNIQDQLHYLDGGLILESQQQKWVLDQLLIEQNPGLPQEYVSSFNVMFEGLSTILDRVSLEYEELLYHLIENPRIRLSLSECSNLVVWAIWIQGHPFPDEEYKMQIIKCLSSSPQDVLFRTTPEQEPDARKFMDMWFLIAEYYKGVKRLSTSEALVILNSIIMYELEDNSRIDTLDKLISRGYRLDRFTSDILIHLFVSYETPHWFHKHFFQAGQLEREVFFHMAKGQSLRFMEGLPEDISRREAFQLAHISKSLVPNNRVENWLKLGVLFAKLVIGGCSTVLMVYLKHHSWKINRLLQYHGMLEDLARFILKQRPEDLLLPDFGDILDYISIIKQEDPDYTLKNRSFRTIQNQSDRWHRMIRRSRISSIPLTRWNPIMVEDYRAEEGNVTFQINQITEFQKLYDEGMELNHCVSTYADQCINGSTAIFSLNRQIEGKGKKRLVTLQVFNRSIIQAKGKNNRAMNGSERNLVQRWADQQGLRTAV